jgi:hypothetical protein
MVTLHCTAVLLLSTAAKALTPAAQALTQLPPGINAYEVAAGARNRPAEALAPVALRAIAAAREAKVKLGEIEFPALLGEKTAFEDVDNVQILNWNRDWCMSSMRPLAEELDGELWLAFPDRKELELAREEWPGQAYAKATITTLEDAAEVMSGSSDQAWGAAFARAAEGLLGTKNLGAAPETAGAPKPRVLIAVQPGDGGPLEDWLNLERCQPSDGLMVSMNGAFDKLRGGYYPRPLFPKLAESVDRFVVDAEPLVYLKSVKDKGRDGWLFRVYPEPWQLIAQGREASLLLETYDERPAYNDCVATLLAAGSVVA